MYYFYGMEKSISLELNHQGKLYQADVCVIYTLEKQQGDYDNPCYVDANIEHIEINTVTVCDDNDNNIIVPSDAVLDQLITDLAELTFQSLNQDEL